MGKEISLEDQILVVAEQLFLEKGFAATSTTDIAKKVGCNQALVHYYYRTKDNLFEQIFLKKIEFALSSADSFKFEGSFIELIKVLISAYFQMLNKNRRLPFFIMNELIMNEKRREFICENIIQNAHRQKVYYTFDQIVQNEVAKGTIRPIKSLDLLLNIVSLTVLSFVALPIYTDWLQKTDVEVDAFIEERKNEVITLIEKGLKP